MMNARIYGPVLAMILVVGSPLAGRAEESTTPPAASQTQSQSPPVSVARPSIVPKASEKASEKAGEQPPSREADAAPPRHRHANRRHERRYAAFWAPFPIYLPHLYRHRIVWSRLPWISF
jgi:hypothetical protein